MGCIYLVTNKINSKQYVGKTVKSLQVRRKEHEAGAQKKKSSIHFHWALAKHGFDVFEWIEVESDVPEEDLDGLKVECIAWFGTKSPNGYNLTDGGDGGAIRFGPHSVETRAKISRGNLGRVLSAETRAKIGRVQVGRVHSAETREKKRRAQLGHAVSEETRKKIRRANLGKTHSEKSKEKNRQAHLGKVMSAESREKIRQANLGHAVSEETKVKLVKASAKNKGKRVNALYRHHRFRDWESCSL